MKFLGRLPSLTKSGGAVKRVGNDPEHEEISLTHAEDHDLKITKVESLAQSPTQGQNPELKDEISLEPCP